MAAQMLTERYRERMTGTLSCYDRIVITGTLPGVCYAGGMTSFLYSRGIRIFDYARFAEPLRDRVRACAQALAASAGVEIEPIAKAPIRNEEVVAKVLARRGEAPGLVHVISAMEACESYKPWHDKARGKTFLKPDSGKCLRYYFYFIDPTVGLIYLRVPTWCPFRLQFYCNGHAWLANKLRAAGMEFTLADNAFVRIADLEGAQRLADELAPKELHRRLDHYAKVCCPVLDEFRQRYHWSLMQVEYSTDLMFRSDTLLAPLYEQLARQAVLAVKAEQLATFLGKVGVKMYDKFGRVLRLETTANDVSFFKHHRKVEHRDGHTTRAVAPSRRCCVHCSDRNSISGDCDAPTSARSCRYYLTRLGRAAIAAACSLTQFNIVPTLARAL